METPRGTGIFVGGKEWKSGMEDAERTAFFQASAADPVLAERRAQQPEIQAARSLFGGAVSEPTMRSVNENMRGALARAAWSPDPVDRQRAVEDAVSSADSDDEVNLALMLIEAEPPVSAQEARRAALENSARSRGSAAVAQALEPRARRERAALMGDAFVRAQGDADAWARKFGERDGILDNIAYDEWQKTSLGARYGKRMAELEAFPSLI